MNKLTRFTLLFAAVVMFLTGCTQHQRFGNDPPIIYPTNHAVKPILLPGKYGGSMTATFLSDPKTFNLWVADDADSSNIVGVLYDSLEGRNSFTLQFEPRLAYLPKISADGLVYTYTLRPNLKWSDGYPITADDVIFTLNVIFDTKVDCPLREIMLLDVPQPDGTSKQEPFIYKKLNDRTVQFTLPERWAPAQGMFGFAIAPKHVLEHIYMEGKFNSAWGIDTPPSELVASGPFVMADYVPQQRIIFKRNPYFWKSGLANTRLPYLDSFQYEITPDTNSMVLNFRSGSSDALDVPIQQYPSIARYEHRDNYTLIDKGADWGFSYLCFNQNPTSTMAKSPKLLKLFEDVRFRRACSYAVNRQTICDEVALGLAHPLWSPETPADVNYFDSKVPQYPYNPDKAKALLSQIGCEPGPNGMLTYEGVPVKFNILTNVENAARKATETIVANNLQQVGIDATYTALNFNDLIRRVDAPPYDWQACVMGFTGGPEPNDGAVIWRSSGPYHQWDPKENSPATPWEKRIDDDFAKGAQELNPRKRKVYYDDWQEVLGEQQPFIFLVYGDDYTALRNHFGNIEPTPFYGLGGSVYWNLEEIYDRRAVKPSP